MYRDFYGLDSDPFSLDPDLDFLFLSKGHEEAVAHVVYGLEQGETIILITGDIGTGKTLALHRTLEQVSGTTKTVLLNVTTVEFPEFMRLVMFKLGDTDPPREVSSLLDSLERRLVEMRRAGERLLLVVDEAQNLSTETLESVRLLLNLAQPGTKVLQLLLVGQNGLEDLLTREDLRQLRQRIRVAYRLEKLSADETAAYIAHRLHVAGRGQPLFERSALERIHELSGGVPRLVNHLANKALLAGFVDGRKTIGAGLVEADPGDWDEPLYNAPHPSPVREASPQEPVPTLRKESVSVTPPPPAVQERPSPGQAYGRRRGRGRGRIGWALAALLLVAALVASPWWGPRIGWFPDWPWSPVARTSERFLDQGPRNLAEVRPAATPTDEIPLSRPEPPVAQANADPNPGRDLSADDPPTDTGTPESIEPATAVVLETEVGAAPDPVSVHVFSFRTAARAENSRGRLERAGVPVFVRSYPASGGRSWHRVYLGPFPGRERALSVVERLKGEGEIQYYALKQVMPEAR